LGLLEVDRGVLGEGLLELGLQGAAGIGRKTVRG
jgi:hypothetical protein